MNAFRFPALSFVLLMTTFAPAGAAPAAARAKAAPAAAAVTLNPGDKAPDFTLVDTDGVTHSLSRYLADGKIVVLEWFDPDCPFILKHHKLDQTMVDIYAYMKPKGTVWLAINSGAPGKPGSDPKRNRAAHEEYAMTFPILLDGTGAVGRSYGARTTPHMFVIGKDGKVAYNGAVDDDASPTGRGKRNYIISAIRAVIDGRPVREPVTEPYGCSVKYAD